MATDDHFEPWRKQGFICKPFAGDRGDGDRFVSEFLDEAEGSPKKHPPSPACSNATQQFCSSEPSSLEPSPTKPKPEPKPAYDGPAMRTRSKTKHA